MQGGRLPLIDICDIQRSRNEVHGDCIPLYNALSFRGNISTPDKLYLIHTDPSSESMFALTDSLTLTRIDSDSAILDRNSENIVILNVLKNYLLQTSLFYDQEIYWFFLLMKHDEIFNVILSQDNKFINQLFRIDTTSKKFIGFSVSFNIFNVTLFTHNFFDIFSLFCKYFKGEKVQSNVEIIKDLKSIFNNKELLCSIYDLALYKKQILSFHKETRPILLSDLFAKNNKNLENTKVIIDS